MKHKTPSIGHLERITAFCRPEAGSKETIDELEVRLKSEGHRVIEKTSEGVLVELPLADQSPTPTPNSPTPNSPTQPTTIRGNVLSTNTPKQS